MVAEVGTEHMVVLQEGGLAGQEREVGGRQANGETLAIVQLGADDSLTSRNGGGKGLVGGLT